MTRLDETSGGKSLGVQVHRPFDPAPPANPGEEPHPETEQRRVGQRNDHLGVSGRHPRESKTIMKACGETEKLPLTGVPGANPTHLVLRSPRLVLTAAILSPCRINANLHLRHAHVEEFRQLVC